MLATAGRYAACAPSEAAIAASSRTIATPQSYGTLRVLCASVAQESARVDAREQVPQPRAAAAHSPNAPSTCTHAPAAWATVDRGGEVVERAGVHVAGLQRDDRRPVVLGERGGQSVDVDAPLLVGADGDGCAEPGRCAPRARPRCARRRRRGSGSLGAPWMPAHGSCPRIAQHRVARDDQGTRGWRWSRR